MKFTKIPKRGPPFGSQNHLSHGKSKSAAYYCWRNMLNRCRWPKSNSFKHYGAKGIRVLWESFEAFYADMGDPPEGMTIERIDNDGHYCKENCRWATRVEQGRNRSRYHLITFRGETRDLAEWARITGIKYTTLRQRIVAYRWPLERAFIALYE